MFSASLDKGTVFLIDATGEDKTLSDDPRGCMGDFKESDCDFRDSASTIFKGDFKGDFTTCDFAEADRPVSTVGSCDSSCPSFAASLTVDLALDSEILGLVTARGDLLVTTTAILGGDSIIVLGSEVVAFFGDLFVKVLMGDLAEVRVDNFGGEGKAPLAGGIDMSPAAKVSFSTMISSESGSSFKIKIG